MKLIDKKLIRRLRKAGKESDEGKTIDTTGMSDKEFIQLLRGIKK